MSQLNFSALNEPENQLHNRNVKQYGTSDLNMPPRSAVKKTALTDVKNILGQRTIHSARKPLSSSTKPSISKKDLLGIFNDKENYTSKKDTGIKNDNDIPQATETYSCAGSPLINKDNCDAVFEEPVCSFCDKVEDDYADILMQKLTLSKNEIETLALEWERQPKVGLCDMREIEIPSAILCEVDDTFNDWPGFDYESDTSLLNDIPYVESILDSEE